MLSQFRAICFLLLSTAGCYGRSHYLTRRELRRLIALLRLKSPEFVLANSSGKFERKKSVGFPLQ
jgi:hypothetical protein